MVMEKEPTGLPSFEDGEYPDIIEVAGLGISHEQLVRRLHRFMTELPRLKLNYQDEIIASYKDRKYLTSNEFSKLCAKLSLRDIYFTYMVDDQQFENDFPENLKIARERGSHP